MSIQPAHKQVGQRAFMISAMVFVVVFVIGLLGSSALQSQQDETKRARVTALSQSYAYHLQNSLEHTLSSNYTLAGLVRQFGGFTRWFPEVAESLHKIYPIVNNFALSPNGIVTQTYPLEGNEQVLGFNALADTEQGSEAWNALTQQELTLAGPVDLVQGGKGLVARLPVTLEDRWGGAGQFWGFTNVVIRIEPLLESIKFSGLAEQGYAVSLERVDAEQAIVISSSQAELLEDPVEHLISLPNAQWRLSVSPVQGWLPDTLLGFYILASLIVALVVARLVFLAYRIRAQKQLLAELLSQQTAQTQATQKRLLTTLQAVPDPLIEIDGNGIVRELHAPEDETEVKQCFVVGEAFSAYLSQAAVTVFEQALYHARAESVDRGAFFQIALDGKVIWFEISVVYSKVSPQEEGRFVVLLRDITVRQDAEEQLRIAATAFETQDGILISDKDNRIIRVNRAFQHITGYSEQDVIGATPAILSSGRHSKEFYQLLYTQLQEQGSWEGEVWNRRKDGEVFPEWLSISTVYDHSGDVSHYVATFKDISERKASERKIRQLHYYDTLTRLANRTLMLEEINYLIQEKGLHKHQSIILFIDIDHFKDVNDVWGHNIGDQLLQQVASRLVEAIRAKDLVARYGGDEFLILLEEVDVSAKPERALYRASRVAQKLLNTLTRAFSVNSIEYQLSASIGIAVIDEYSQDALDAIKQAELAMYEAKSSGRSQFCFYQARMQERVLARVHLENDLRHAIDNGELVLYLQPQWNGARQVIGVEALLRWQHPVRGMVSPAEFIPIAEETRLILPIGDWVLHSACRQLADWQDDPAMQNLIMSINVSAVQFAQEDFVAQVEQAITEHRIDAGRLQLELTESMLAHDQQDIITKMTALKTLGVLISLDDFGTGYSSLSYLHRLPIDQLKIDQSFIVNVEAQAKNAAVAESIISLGHNLGMEVIAEGVETQQQFDWLAARQCDLFQGFGLAKPIPVDSLAQLLNQVHND
ncbi:EAL domain-containing protein [Marinomonas ostreistagni]|uniref:EAL domain-containing protein n=1 Tax=Marinomonas ostreistagni TaxID=359209 RepID=UPI0019524E18|nr:EAL domain-containing protein [Marinomonas ostreistagni]MBM6552277.1 EAL domain-containing protein [Marinomonas ostreistagni]